ncbi:MAG: S-adenosylmethionine:tRNA ribosyltransferase-isomerase, partial [Chloroflexota bacterium]
ITTRLSNHSGNSRKHKLQPQTRERTRSFKPYIPKQAGKRIIAVGTTVVRALETVVDSDGLVHPGEGWTRLVITPDRPLQAVNGMLTGLHEPEATHLAMLQALADLEHLELSYTEALQHHYLWHEFGDLHLILSLINPIYIF